MLIIASRHFPQSPSDRSSHFLSCCREHQCCRLSRLLCSKLPADGIEVGNGLPHLGQTLDKCNDINKRTSTKLKRRSENIPRQKSWLLCSQRLKNYYGATVFCYTKVVIISHLSANKSHNRQGKF